MRIFIAILMSMVVVGIFFAGAHWLHAVAGTAKMPYHNPVGTVDNSAYHLFRDDGVLQEAGSERESSSGSLWLDSGGIFVLKDGVGETVQGSLSPDDPWRMLYANSAAADTDNGYHPQNLFRLLWRATVGDASQHAYFKVIRDNVSDSLNRNASNGLFLMSRYRDHDNFYYVGLRVDGAAVIKKKYKGVYYEMAYEKITPGAIYDRSRNTSLLPKGQWLGIKSIITNNADGSLTIQMLTDLNRTGNWVEVASVRDNGVSYGGAILGDSAHLGIRTDFMDVMIDDYALH